MSPRIESHRYLQMTARPTRKEALRSAQTSAKRTLSLFCSIWGPLACVFSDSPPKSETLNRRNGRIIRGRLKMQDRKMTDRKMTDKSARWEYRCYRQFPFSRCTTVIEHNLPQIMMQAYTISIRLHYMKLYSIACPVYGCANVQWRRVQYTITKFETYHLKLINKMK